MLSLYSTGPKTLGVGSWHWLRPAMPQFCIGYTNMLISKNAKICVTPDAKPKICVSPNAKPQRKSVEYRLRWVPNANFSPWACTFHILCRFHLCWIPHFQWNMGFSICNTKRLCCVEETNAKCYIPLTFALPLCYPHIKPIFYQNEIYTYNMKCTGPKRI